MAGSVILQIDHTYTTLMRGKPSSILPPLRFDNPAARHSAYSPEFITFYEADRRRFPTGLLPLVQNHLKSRGLMVRVRDLRDKTPIPLDGVDSKMIADELRSDQVEAVRRAISCERGALGLATNFGKGHVLSAIASHLVNVMDYKGLIVVPNIGLLEQFSRDITRLTCGSVGVGIVGDGQFRPNVVTVATAQTLMYGVPVSPSMPRARQRTRSARYNPKINALIRSADFILVDEAHHASADTWREILSESVARVRIGCTGTLKSGDIVKDTTIEAFLGPQIMKVGNETLIEAGHSARVYVFSLTDSDVFTVDYTAAATKTVKSRHPVTNRVITTEVPVDPAVRFAKEKDGVAGDKTINRAIARVCSAAVQGGLKPLVLTDRLAHLRDLDQFIRQRGLNTVMVDGATTQRLSRVREFEHDANAVLLGSTVFDEGFNAPSIGLLVLAGSGKSERRVLQRIGRALRKKHKGINAVAILDISATNGFFIARHTAKRLALYRREKFVVKDVPDIRRLCKRMKRGWKGLLGKERYAKLLAKQNAVSSPSPVTTPPSGRASKPRSVSPTR